MNYIIVTLLSYLLGSMPTGYLWGRAVGKDVRKHGSGNIGATNVFRVLGKTAGITVLLIDALKGYGAAVWIPSLVNSLPLGEASQQGDVSLMLIGGFLGIIGHNYTCWLGFKGGKGIATSAGVLLGLLPQSFLVALITWIILMLLFRYVSVASIGAAAALPVSAFIFKSPGQLKALAILMGVMAIWKHRPNIERLKNGHEHRIQFGQDNHNQKTG